MMETARLIIAEGQVRCARFGDVYASSAGAWEQAQQVFLAGVDLAGLARQRGQLRLLELGFGLGSNFLASWDCWRRLASAQASLDYLAVEAYPLTRAQFLQLPTRSGVPPALLEQLVDCWPAPEPGLHRIELEQGRLRLLLWFGEVTAGLRELEAPVDAAYLDGFAPACNPAMWQAAVMRQLLRLLRPGARVASYSVASVVRTELADAGFEVHREPGFAHKRQRLVAIRPGAALAVPDLGKTVGPVAVIGAGIAGSACAEALCRAGIEVQIFDPHGFALAGASGNPAALLHPETATDLPARLHNHALRLALSAFARLQDAGLDCGHHATGVLRVEPQGGTCGTERDAESSTCGTERDAESNTCGTERDAESSTCGTERDPESTTWQALPGGWVQPARLVQALRTAAADRLQMHRHAVTAIEPVESGWLLRTGAGSFSAGQVVLACGLDAARLWPVLAGRLHPVAGQIELLSGDFSQLQQPRLGPRWLLPIDATHAIAGASFLPEVTTAEVDPQQSTLTLAAFPEHRHWTLTGSRAGVRVVSRDRRLLAGPCPAPGLQFLRNGWPEAAPGLWASLALGSRGFAGAFLAAELVAAGISGRHPAVPQSLRLAVEPRRFWRR